MNAEKKRVLITGATGFIGTELVLSLARVGYDLTLLVRDVKKASHLPGDKFMWDGKTSPKVILELPPFYAVIHLSGEPIANRRWNEKIKRQIFSSRVNSTKNLVSVFSDMPPGQRPSVFLSGSAIGIYGDRGDEELTENARKGTGFLSDLCQEWEAEASRATSLGIRTVYLRTGVVFGRSGGALEKMQPVVMGDGKFWMSWIHIDDVIGLIQFALANDVKGPLNLTSAKPVTNREFAHQLKKQLGSMPLPSVPKFIIKAALGEMSQLILSSQKVFPKVAQESGYVFRFARLEDALKNIFEYRRTRIQELFL